MNRRRDQGSAFPAWSKVVEAQRAEFDLIPLRPAQARKARRPRVGAFLIGKVIDKPSAIVGHRGATLSAKASRDSTRGRSP